MFVEPLITTRQLAELWCQTPRWVLRMAKEQGLPHYELGDALRYRSSEVEAWLQQHHSGHPTHTDAAADTLASLGTVELRSVASARGVA
jgi:predicted DNA-binding transcriptional regulator AlpA